MVTKNFKTFMSVILQANSNQNYGMFAVKNINGVTRYINPRFNDPYCFPYAVYRDCRLNNDPGIHFGSGTTAATENDYCLESKITSGLQFQLGQVKGLDANDYPYLRYDIMVTNSSANTITIAELGYAQQFMTAETQGATTDARHVLLLDRTVLAEPVVLAPQEYALIRYTFKTVIPS